MVVDKAAYQAWVQTLKEKLANLQQLVVAAYPAGSDELSSDGTQRTKCPACRHPVRLGIAEADQQPATSEPGAEGMPCPPAASAAADHQPSTLEPGVWGMICPHCKKALTVLKDESAGSEAS